MNSAAGMDVIFSSKCVCAASGVKVCGTCVHKGVWCPFRTVALNISGIRVRLSVCVELDARRMVAKYFQHRP